MKITAKTNTKDLRQRMANYARIVGRDAADALRRHARIAAVDLCNSMTPYSHGVSAKAKGLGEAAVQRDILKVYHSATGARFREQATRVARAHAMRSNNKNVRGQAEKFKDRLLRYQMSDNTEALAKIAADMKFRDVMIDRLDRNRHKVERGPDGRVKNPAPVIVIGADREIERYIEETKRKVGLTKAGFAKVAAAIPTSLQGDPMKGVPAWVKRNVSRASGRMTDRTRGAFIEKVGNIGVGMDNTTPWASNTITPSQVRRSLDVTRQKFVKYMNHSIRGELKRRAGLK